MFGTIFIVAAQVFLWAVLHPDYAMLLTALGGLCFCIDENRRQIIKAIKENK
jgi:hypothetical protein